MREEKITEQFIEILRQKKCNVKFCEPKKCEHFESFHYDIVAKRNSKIVALIEAKNRTFSDRPTTDSTISSLIKLLYEWVFKFERKSKIKLIYLVYLKSGQNPIEKEKFRNGIIKKLTNFLKQIGKVKKTKKGVRIPEINVCNIKIDVKNSKVKFYPEDLEKFINYIKDP